MAKIDARDWIFEIEVPGIDPAPATWVEIGGINTWELDRNANSATTEDTTNKSKGQYEGHASQRGGSLNVEGYWEVEDDDETVQDAGQVAVDALAEKVGRASNAGFRFRHESHTEWVVWPRAHVEPGAVGGGHNDNTTWSANFIRSGAATTEAVV